MTTATYDECLDDRITFAPGTLKAMAWLTMAAFSCASWAALISMLHLVQ